MPSTYPVRGLHFGTMQDAKGFRLDRQADGLLYFGADERTQNGEATTEHYRSRIPQPVGAPVDDRVGATCAECMVTASRKVKAAAAGLRAMVDPALGVPEYEMRRKDKDLRGALQIAKEVLDRAKPEGESPGGRAYRAARIE